MAAFPMVQAPVFHEFKGRLIKEYGCEYKTLSGLKNGDDESVPITYFERKVDGKILTYPVDISDESDRIGNWVVKSILKQMKIPLKDFGLSMD